MSFASAPGKIILFGEHAVVYGQPALAVPVTQVQAQVRIEELFTPGLWIHAPDIHLHSRIDDLAPSHPIAATVRNTLAALDVASLSGVSLLIESTVPVASGLGSGAAVSVAIIRALSNHLKQTLPADQVSTLAFETEKLHHGTPSGIDNTVVTYAKPVYFVKQQPIEILQVKKPFTVVIGDTGVSAVTKETVDDVRKRRQAAREKFDALFAAIGSLVRTARQIIESGLPDSLGPLMNENHELLCELTVSSPELDQLVKIARQSGALGAKMSGGGRGGNMIALVQAESANAVARSLNEAGAVHTIITKVA